MKQVFDKTLAVHSGKSNTDLISAIIDPTQVVWLRVNDKTSARYGSIGIAIPDGESLDDRSWGPSTPSIKKLYEVILKKQQQQYVYYYDIDYQLKIFRATVLFGDDKSSKSQNLYNYGNLYGRNAGIYEWLQDYDGEQFFQFTKGQREIPKKYDMLGKEIKEGDFGVVAYAKYDLRFGTVDRVSPAGAVYVKTFTQTETQSRYYSEVRLSQGSQFLKISADTYDEAVISKLMFG